MSLTFWDTIRGNHLADILIRELPKLTKKKAQYAETMADAEVPAFLAERIGAGERYINHFSYNGETTVIMEKQ